MCPLLANSKLNTYKERDSKKCNSEFVDAELTKLSKIWGATLGCFRKDLSNRTFTSDCIMYFAQRHSTEEQRS